MPHRTFKNERAVLAQWAGALLVIAACAIALNLGIHEYVKHLKANSPWTYVKRGIERMRANDFDEALALFRQGAQVAPESPMPHEHIGLLYYERQDFAKAREAYEKAIALGSVNPDARGKLLWAYIHTGAYAQAVEIGERSIREKLANPQFHRWIADAHFRAGNFESCIDHFELALRHQEDLYVMSKLVRAYEHTGRIKQAESLRQRIEVLEAS